MNKSINFETCLIDLYVIIYIISIIIFILYCNYILGILFILSSIVTIYHNKKIIYIKFIKPYVNYIRNYKKKKTFVKTESNGETICHEIIKEIFPEYSFNKIRPEWLKNPDTNRCLELDLFCRELNLAIEYNGKQHYEYNKFFHKNISNFESQCERDELKKHLCTLHGITLITVPYKYNTKQSIREYILNRLPYYLFNYM
jgi:hypothetical protein